MALICTTDRCFPAVDNPDFMLNITHIESGCLVYESDDQVWFVIRDSTGYVSSMRDPVSLKLKFSPVMKAEFPALQTIFILRNNKGLSRKYEYFFMAESEKDSDILRKLSLNKTFLLNFFDDVPGASFQCTLDDGEGSELDREFSDICDLLTKSAHT